MKAKRALVEAVVEAVLLLLVLAGAAILGTW
jgi:hypothetical protein